MLFRGRLHPDPGGVDHRVGRQEAIVDHRFDHNPGAATRGIDIGGGRVIGWRLDQPGDDRRFTQAQLVGTMTVEGAAGGIDAISAATKINAVEIKFEDLILAEFALEREGQHAFLYLASERAAVRQEDIARQLLRDGRPTLPPLAGLKPDLDRSRHADRVDPDVPAKSFVLDRDHSRAHRRRDIFVRQPLPETGAHRYQYRAVRGAHSDHLTKVVTLRQFVIIGQ